jgi:hypothetical protein
MRLSQNTLTEEGRKELTDFSKWMLDISEGNVEATTKEGIFMDKNTRRISFKTQWR